MHWYKYLVRLMQFVSSKYMILVPVITPKNGNSGWNQIRKNIWRLLLPIVQKVKKLDAYNKNCYNAASS